MFPLRSTLAFARASRTVLSPALRSALRPRGGLSQRGKCSTVLLFTSSSNRNAPSANTRRCFASVSTAGEEPPIRAALDTYGGVVINSDPDNLAADTFEERLVISLDMWREKKYRGVWLRLPIESSALVPIAVKYGFHFHHCREDYLLLCMWLDESTPSRLPRGPSHYIGVAGFVVNSKDELLMIKEKDGPSKALDIWKLPGGLLDRNENIETGVVREVFEETGLNCEFVRLAAIVESHYGTGPMRETSSDFYCISVLRLLDESQLISPQMEEIEACDWIPISKVLSFPLYAPNAAFGECFRSALRVRNDELENVGLISETFPVRIGGKAKSKMVNILQTNNKTT
jgi:ADP-ribose pyrophosphatase YjhB (NUDIX family)